MSRCRETLRPCRRPNRILAKRFLRLLSPRPCPRPPRREKRFQGLPALKPQGNQLGYPSRRRLQLPERHRLPSSRLVRLCHCQPLLKHRRPSINIARRAWAHTSGKRSAGRLDSGCCGCDKQHISFNLQANGGTRCAGSAAMLCPSKHRKRNRSARWTL